MIQIQPKHHEAITKLVVEGKYSSIESFTETAVRNLLTLEQEHQTNVGTVVSVPERHSASLMKPMTVEPAPLDNERKDLPIWGLINRYAPAKMVLRELSAELVSNNAEWIDFKQFAESTVLKATKLRTELRKRVEASNMVRGKSLQTGFPQKDVRSQQRFVDLYIGRLRSNNRMDGVLGDLELAAMRKSPMGNLQIGITQAGLEWSMLRSEYLDDISSNSDMEAFTNHEKRYLLSHISRVRPGEFSFLDYLFIAVRNGTNTPEELGLSVRSYSENKRWKNANGERISDAEVNTLKVGGIARLVEMRFLGISKNGNLSTYTSLADMNDLYPMLHVWDKDEEDD